jgi:hypothetical protein
VVDLVVEKVVEFVVENQAFSHYFLKRLMAVV